MSQYICWNCGLLQGDEWEPWEPSRLCPACSKAMNRRYNRERCDQEEEEN